VGIIPTRRLLAPSTRCSPRETISEPWLRPAARTYQFLWIHPRIETTLPHGVTASFDWIVQWRQNLNDGVYAVPGFLIRAADGSRVRFVGHRPGTEIRWQANRHRWLRADYGIFYAGRFLRETQPGRNLNYVALAETIPAGDGEPLPLSRCLRVQPWV